MTLDDLKDTLWNDWIEALRLAQRSPYEETVDFDISSRHRNDDTLERALRGEWDELCMEAQEANMDWITENDDSARKNEWEGAIRKHKNALNSLDLGEDEELDDLTRDLFEEFEERLQEEESDLCYGYTEISFRLVGSADIQLTIEYNGVSGGSDWFEDELDENDNEQRCFKPKKDFIGLLTLLNLSKDAFVEELLNENGARDWSRTEFQKAQFKEAIDAAHHEYVMFFGHPLLDPQTLPAVTAKNLAEWVGKLFESQEELTSLCTTISLSGPELTELAEGLAIAKGNVSDPLQMQHWMKVWVGKGAELHDAEGNVSTPLILDAPLLLPTEDQFAIDNDYSGEKVDLTFPVIDAWRAKRKVEELIRKEKEEGVDMSSRMTYEIKNLDLTPGDQTDRNAEFLDRVLKLGATVRPFTDRDLRWPPNPDVLTYLASDEGKGWKTSSGEPALHAVWSSFPNDVVRKFVEESRASLLERNATQSTVVHLLAYAYANRNYPSQDTKLAEWLNAETLHAKNEAGETPLSLLVNSKHKELTEDLINALDAAGVDWTAENGARKGQSLAERFNLVDHSFVQRQQLQKRVAASLAVQPKDARAL
jgi:hypothetical protein